MNSSLTESAFQLGLGWQQSTGYDLAMVGDRMVAGDFTCDGVDDIAAGYDSGGALRLDVWGGTSTTSGPRVWGTSSVAPSAIGAQMTVGDFDGNGCTDIAVFEAVGTAGARIHRFLSNGTTFTETTSGDWSVPVRLRSPTSVMDFRLGYEIGVRRSSPSRSATFSTARSPVS